MGKWPFMVGSQLKACHTLPVNWTEFSFVDKSAIKAVFNWRVHLETAFTGSPHVSLVSCVPMQLYMTGGEKDNMNPALDLERWFGVSSVVAYELFCVFIGLVINIISCLDFWGENINSTRNKHQMYQQLLLTGGWQLSCTWYFHGCNNLTLGPLTWISYMCPGLFITFFEWINNHLAFSLDPLLWPICSAA